VATLSRLTKLRGDFSTDLLSLFYKIALYKQESFPKALLAALSRLTQFLIRLFTRALFEWGDFVKETYLSGVIL